MWILIALAAQAADPEVVGASLFALEQPYDDAYRADHPRVDGGSLVFLAVEPGSYVVRDIGTPVLYAGTRPVAVVAHGDTCLVAIVPREVDLAVEPIFFGPPDLPEQVDPLHAAEVRDQAVVRGARPQLPAGLRSDPPLILRDEGALREEAVRRLAGCR